MRVWIDYQIDNEESKPLLMAELSEDDVNDAIKKMIQVIAETLLKYTKENKNES